MSAADRTLQHRSLALDLLLVLGVTRLLPGRRRHPLRLSPPDRAEHLQLVVQLFRVALGVGEISPRASLDRGDYPVGGLRVLGTAGHSLQPALQRVLGAPLQLEVGSGCVGRADGAVLVRQVQPLRLAQFRQHAAAPRRIPQQRGRVVHGAVDPLVRVAGRVVVTRAGGDELSAAYAFGVAIRHRLRVDVQPGRESRLVGVVDALDDALE